MPSYSIGFCVARTRNGRSSGRVTPVRRHLPLLHRLEQRGLRLRRSAVDLVGEQEVGEDRPGPELEVAVALVPDRRAGDVGGEQVRRELDAAEAEPARLGERARGQRLREPGHVLEQDVAVGEQAEQDELELLALADDRALDLVDQAAAELGQLPQLHQTCSRAVTTRSRSASSIPGPWRSAGCGRSGRTSSQASSPRTARARSGSARDRSRGATRAAPRRAP